MPDLSPDDLDPLQASLQSLSREADGFASAITRAFAGAVAGGKDFDDVLKGLALRLSTLALSAALKPIETGISGALGSLLSGITGFAKGGIPGGVVPFAEGGIVSSPSYFPLSGGLGVMGEAGAEAVMPLARGPDGRLGVAGGGSGVTVNVAISTPDAESFKKSEAQVTAALARAVLRGRRGM